MKTTNQKHCRIAIGHFFLILAGLFIPAACEKEEVVPKNETKEIVNETNQHPSFTMNGEIKSTSSGFDVKGTLSTKESDGESFDIGEGEFNIVVGSNGDVESISGTGTPVFPKVGIFKELLKEFVFSEIVSRIEYESGKYFKEHYTTDIPLDDNTRYLHYQVLNENNDGPYQLRHQASNLIYKFFDLYVDPMDPALFFKVQLWLPGSNGDDLVKTFWQKIKAAGHAVKEFGGAPGMIFGISNKAKFKTTTYDFNVTDKKTFKEIYGFDTFESLNSHIYLKLKEVPIPETVVLQLTGEMFIHEPIESLVISPEELKKRKLYAFLDWFNEGESHSIMATFAGSMDPGGAGIGTVLQGVLPKINEITGKDLVNEDLNIDILGATLQYQLPRVDEIGNGSAFFRFGGQISKPLIADLLSEEIKKFVISSPGFKEFIYFNLGAEEDATFFIEASENLVIPKYGEVEFGKSHFMINKDGINFSGKLNLPLGPLNISKSVTGKFNKTSYALHVIHDKDITLPNGVVLASQDLDVNISSETGVHVSGNVVMPFGIGEAHVTGSLTNDGMTLEGSLNAGTTIDLGNGLLLPSANMTFSVSTDPTQGIHLKGDLLIPHGIGYIAVDGFLTKDGFSFKGIIDKQIGFGGANLLSKSGVLTISSTEGIHFKSVFSLGASFGDRTLEGSITESAISLSGTFSGGIPIGGHTFTFANGKITAHSANGVSISGNINLYFFQANVTGKLIGLNNFNLTGSANYNTAILKATISCSVKQSGVTLSGNGTVYGLLGNPLYTGALTFEPNWSNQTIRVCYNNICFNL